MLLVLIVLAVLLSLWEPAFHKLGALVYAPALFLIAVAGSTFAIHVYFRLTIDKDTHECVFAKEWAQLTPFQRCVLQIVTRLGFLLGACIVIAALAK